MSAPLPPTPTESAASALTEGAKDMAKDAALRRFQRFARAKLPRFVYNLIFSGKSAGELAADEARRRIRRLLWGCGCSAGMGCVVVVVLAFVVVVVGWALAFG